MKYWANLRQCFYWFKQKSNFFILLLFTTSYAYAQNDTSYVLTQEEVLSIVKKYHPVVKQTLLENEKAASVIQQARGGFDPLLTTDFEKKKFSNELYYSYFNPQITIPTWYGIELRAGLEEIYGDKTANELTLGQTSYLGIKVPLGKDLLFDKRRASLQQAKAFQQQTFAEQKNTVNDVLFDAIAAYWNWVYQYRAYAIISNAVKNNEARLRFVIIEFEQGSRPAIDTTEAYTQLQSFQLAQNQTWLAFMNAGIELSAYLWLENNLPLNWSDKIIPDIKSLDTSLKNLPPVDELLTLAMNDHPKLQSFTYKLDILEIERRLKQQSLLPKFDVKANLLNKGYNVFKGIDAGYLQENYKYGINFAMPLLLRESRGALKQTKIKVQQTSFDQQLMQMQIGNKVKSYYNENMVLQKQVTIAQQSYNNYQRLFRGEELRFKEGESTLFLLNARENKMLEAEQKLAEVKAKFNKSAAAVYWATGQLK